MEPISDSLVSEQIFAYAKIEYNKSISSRTVSQDTEMNSKATLINDYLTLKKSKKLVTPWMLRAFQMWSVIEDSNQLMPPSSS